MANGRARQIAWFVGLWVTGVLTIAAIAFALRLVLPGG